MAIVLYRVDERLIHGQVVIGWGSQLQPSRYLVVDDALADAVRVTVIATGFEKPSRMPLFTEDSTGRRREPRRRDVTMDDRQRASLEISDDDIDVPSFLKD